MDEAKRKLVISWLIKASHDFESAKRLSSGPDPILDTAIYHCQQAAEKAIKGYLIYCDEPFEKIHDLKILAKQAAKHATAFAGWIEIADMLTPYASRFRYPDSDFPDVEEFEEALRHTGDILELVLSILPASFRP